MTWEDINKKYPESRCDMSEERERKFVEDCFACYEQEGFANVFWSQGSDYSEYIGKKFAVLGRVPEWDIQHRDGADLECLPMWKIRFEDGTEIDAYPDEIIVSEMVENGCPADIVGTKLRNRKES